MDPLPLADIARATGATLSGDGAALVRRVVCDSREVEPGDLYVALRGERHDGHTFVGDALRAGAAACLVEHAPAPPPLPLGGVRAPTGRGEGAPPGALLLVADTRRALGALAAWYRRRLTAPVVAITGSNGKTTTKFLLAHLLGKYHGGVVASPRSFNNDVGVPLTILSASGTSTHLLLELGTNHPGEIAALAAMAAPDLAIITSIGESHLEHLHSIAGVAAEKGSLLAHLRPGGTAILNADMPGFEIACAHLPPDRALITFSTQRRADYAATRLQQSELTRGQSFRLNGRHTVKLPVPGRHNVANALAALAAAHRLGLPLEELKHALLDAELPPQRLQYRNLGELTLINDAYNANPASVRAAVRELADFPARACHRKTFVLGDMLELGAQSAALHRDIGRFLARQPFDQFVTVGFESIHAEQALRAAGRPVVHFENATEAGYALACGVQRCDVVLLKGSRGMRLERIEEIIVRYLQRRGTQRRTARPSRLLRA